MKVLLVLCLLLSGAMFGEVNGQDSTSRKSGFVLTFNEQELTRFEVIARYDTVINSERVRGQLWKDSISSRTARYYYKQRSKREKFERVDVFEGGLLIYSSIKENGFPWVAYSYTYDTRGRLIEASGYGSGDSGSTTRYYYRYVFTVTK